MIIYKITNTVNGHFYIGKTTLSIDERFKKHYYSHKTGQTYLYKAMRKYGFDNFVIEEIETDIKNLDESEKLYIAELNPQYNMTNGGEGGGNIADSPNFIKSMNEYHSRKPRHEYATYGMFGKSHRGKGKPLKKNMCPVSCEGKFFESVGKAQNYYQGISIRKRIDNPKYPDFFRLKPKRKYPAAN